MIRRRMGWLAAAVVLAGSITGQAPGVTYDWRAGQGVAGLDGPMCASVTWDPDGPGPLPKVLVVGGVFEVASDVVVNHVATWDGQAWHRLGDGLDWAVQSLVVYNGQLVAGGWSSTPDSMIRGHLARWNGGQWEPLGDFDEQVLAMIVYDGRLAVGGSFTTIDDQPYGGIACWDGSDWQSLGEGFNGQYPCVVALAIYDGQLIAGGQDLADEGATCISRWDGQQWLPLGTGLSSTAAEGQYPCVQALTVYDGELIAGGYFLAAGQDDTCRYLARWDGTTWRPVDPTSNIVPESLLVCGGQLFVSAYRLIGQSLDLSGVRSWDGQEWHFLPGEIYGQINLGTYNGDLIVGANVDLAETTCVNIGRWDGSQWHQMGEGMHGSIEALGTWNNDLIAAGYIPGYGSATSSTVLRCNGGQWEPLGDSLAAGGGRCVAGVLGEYDHDLIVGGGFFTAGPETCNGIARWDGSRWRSLAGGMTRDATPGYVSALAIYNGELIAGGGFDAAGGVPCANIARWDGVQWHNLGEGMNVNVAYRRAGVSALAVFHGELVAIGRFDTAGGIACNSIARWDGQRWQPLAGGLRTGSQPASIILAMAAVQDHLIVSGLFLQAGDVSCDGLASWDGSTWQAFGGTGRGLIQHMAVYNNELIAAGVFSDQSAIARDAPPFGLARWDGQYWQPLGAGLNGYPDALLPYKGDLVVAGGFGMAGGKVSAMVARWGPQYAGDITDDGHVDIRDLLTFADSFGKTLGQVGFDAACDLNADNTVDIIDLLMLAEDFGR